MPHGDYVIPSTSLVQCASINFLGTEFSEIIFFVFRQDLTMDLLDLFLYRSRPGCP